MSTQSQWGLAAATPGLVALQEARGTEVVGALPVWEPPRKTSKNGIVHHRFTKTGYKNGIIWLLPHNPAMKHSTPTESQIETSVQFYCSRNLSHPLVSLSLSLGFFALPRCWHHTTESGNPHSLHFILTNPRKSQRNLEFCRLDMSLES